jgi:hypothetical protein
MESDMNSIISLQDIDSFPHLTSKEIVDGDLSLVGYDLLLLLAKDRLGPTAMGYLVRDSTIVALDRLSPIGGKGMVYRSADRSWMNGYFTVRDDRLLFVAP